MSYEGSLMPVDELLREVAVRLAAWSEPLPKVTKHSHMAMQCSFFDDDDDSSMILPRHRNFSFPAVRGAAARERAPPLGQREHSPPRRQYAELHGRDTWNWEHA